MSTDAPITPINGVDQALLDSLNVEQARRENMKALEDLGGASALLKLIDVHPKKGLTAEQVISQRARFGENKFPETPISPFYELLIDALSDQTLIVLLFAATISIILGMTTGDAEHRSHAWIEGAAIYFAVALVSGISAGNDYSKQMQFIALEKASSKDERTTVLRDGVKDRINPNDVVVGDIIVMQAGDAVPADSVIFDETHEVKANESSLTGEPDDLKKSTHRDPFLLSSSLITGGEEVHAVAIGIGTHSQWGKIKANLVSEPSNTPLQDKLEIMTTQIGKLGMIAALMTFIAKILWVVLGEDKNDKDKLIAGVVRAFILAVTIVVVAIPEGLPLAVTISLAYSTSAMYKDQCFIRVLAACETMGNATNICSDKTGTLTENRMTVVEGWYGDHRINQDDFAKAKDIIHPDAITFITEQACINRSAYLVYKNAAGVTLPQPAVIGNKTEGALIMMSVRWGKDYDNMKADNFDEKKDKIYSFNSEKKRSTCIINRKDGSVRIYCKGASEWIIKDCSHFTGKDGKPQPMTEEKRASLVAAIDDMANNALRTLVLAHKDYASPAALPKGWEENPPDNFDLVCDCIVGIIDPLRGDVKEAVRQAQRAGIIVRMVTGDNIATAKAIARQCGILTEGGIAVEGPNFRKMSPADVDMILPNLQVMARSSPEDKYLMVTRLNGEQLPKDVHEWEKKHADKIGVSWLADKDKLMPGYYMEWKATRPDGGQVVGVTGDGSNDAPALKAANVGLAMGITGTKVAQGASDIVILDDKFSSIVKAIMWGRSVYDNIRKFLQFQLTVNVVALTIVFIGAVANTAEPLNAVQMLWVNLVMDTMGALALGTEIPTMELLDRKPYKRTAGLISKPMMRYIAAQSLFQLSMLLLLMFTPQIFSVDIYGKSVPIMDGQRCMEYSYNSKNTWDMGVDGIKSSKSCTYFPKVCERAITDDHIGLYQDYCYQDLFSDEGLKVGGVTYHGVGKVEDFIGQCTTLCTTKDYTHGTVMFNSFIFAQLFNEFCARGLFDEKNPFAGLLGQYEKSEDPNEPPKKGKPNTVFMSVIVVTVALQVFLVFVGGDFVKTSGLSAENFLICIGMGTICLLFNFVQRHIPVVEDLSDFASNPTVEEVIALREAAKRQSAGDVKNEKA